MRKSQFYINQLLAKCDLTALGKITNERHEIHGLTENQMMVILHHDQDLHRITSRFSPYSDIQTNLIKQIEYMENYGKDVAKNVKDINSYISYDLGNMSVYYYSFMITTPNCKLSISSNGELIVTNKYGHNPFRKYRKAISKLNRRLHRIHSPVRIIISAIEHTYDVYNATNPFNVHAHMLVASIGTPIKVNVGRDGRNQFERYLMKYIDDEPTVTVTPIQNRWTHKPVVIISQSNASDYNSITGYVKYILKQKKLPIAKTYDDLNDFESLPLIKQRNLLVATLNSTKGVTLHNHIRYNSFINYINQMAYVATFIAWFHVMETKYRVPISLFDMTKLDGHKGMADHRRFSRHHSTEKERLRTFYGRDRYTGKPLQKHKRHAINQGRTKECKANRKPFKVIDNGHGQLVELNYTDSQRPRIYRNHVDKQTALNIKIINTS